MLVNQFQQGFIVARSGLTLISQCLAFASRLVCRGIFWRRRWHPFLESLHRLRGRKKMRKMYSLFYGKS